VRDGVLVKVQQAADYPDEVYRPRGCMKGLSYLNQVYGEDRIMTPLIRTGERGSGEFREATWDEVLDRIAADMQRIGATWGWDTIHVFGQVPGSGYIQKGANYRASAALGLTHGTSFDFNGDLPMGMPITFGVQNAEHEAKDWANSRFLLLIGSNPVETRIPDVHFLFDAVENGARLVVIDPSFSPTAAKADVHLRIRPGTDAALALAMAHVIVREGLWDERFMRAYTDAPLLVDRATGMRLPAPRDMGYRPADRSRSRRTGWARPATGRRWTGRSRSRRGPAARRRRARRSSSSARSSTAGPRMRPRPSPGSRRRRSSRWRAPTRRRPRPPSSWAAGRTTGSTAT
jgi:anaerobic selenocysteine-containing dehydrogenase